MSRIAKKPIIIPAKTEASFAAGVMTVKGPLGELKKNFRDDVSVTITANPTGAKEIALATTRNTLQAKAMIGTYASHLRNMIAGVNKAYHGLSLESIASCSQSDLFGACRICGDSDRNIITEIFLNSAKRSLTLSTPAANEPLSWRE